MWPKYCFVYFSTAASYLRPAMGQAGSRLDVLTNTMVTRVIFDGRRARGVELQTGGRRKPIRKIYAKEVLEYRVQA
jgi:choline dehydrogenase-like flavoprotein